ncbi:hypothetical protein F5148DRAFT_1252390 [Russula earlei]|uniref:Uncharacterized protein n=1 Tax=Russula earlei TaxID=71964 RepID=A0ACC0TUV4_9AGAM|nr:hypothetical protein F5148DRAFT_1252390 [Russula earlei]
MRSLPLFAVLAYALVCTRASSRTARQVRQSSGGSAHDGLCNEARIPPERGEKKALTRTFFVVRFVRLGREQVMCIEADVEGDTARYVLRSTNAVQLGWMQWASGGSWATARWSSCGRRATPPTAPTPR